LTASQFYGILARSWAGAVLPQRRKTNERQLA